MSVVYLLHFEPPYKHARHYLGQAEDLGARVNAHRHAQGAKLTAAAVRAGCDLQLVRVWAGGTRALERQLKRRHNSPQLCPVCRGEVHP